MHNCRQTNEYYLLSVPFMKYGRDPSKEESVRFFVLTSNTAMNLMKLFLQVVGIGGVNSRVALRIKAGGRPCLAACIKMGGVA